MAISQIEIPIDKDLKREVTALFDDLGLDLPTAINLFLHQCIFHGGLPFTITLPDVSGCSKKAIEEMVLKAYDPKD